jgi:hypothetical protein
MHLISWTLQSGSEQYQVGLEKNSQNRSVRDSKITVDIQRPRLAKAGGADYHIVTPAASAAMATTPWTSAIGGSSPELC